MKQLETEDESPTLEMSVKSQLQAPALAVPFKVRMEPYLIESICAMARLVRDKGSLHSDITGLLFGYGEGGAHTVEAMKAFEDAGPYSELARRQRLGKALDAAVEEAKADPELSGFDVIGWFSFRSGSGLLNSDLAFHNQHFRNPDDLALIIWREGHSQITAELYAKADGDALTTEDYRWASIRLSADIRQMREAIELGLRLKPMKEAYQRAYETSSEPEAHFTGLFRKAEAAGGKFKGLFTKRRPEFVIPPLHPLGSRPADRLAWPPEPREPANSEASFTPRPDTARGMNGSPRGAAAAPQAAQAAVAGASSGGAAAWPAMPPQSAPTRPEFRFNETKFGAPPAFSAPPPPDLGNLGRLPRSGRTLPPEIGGVPMLLQPAATPKKRFPWPLAAALFVICSGAVFAFLLLGGLDSDGGRLGQAFHTIFPGGELNLRVHTEDDRLRLTWNQHNRAVASAVDGTLVIFDGQQHREVHLEGRQVSDGSVLYRPLTNDVTFRLEIHSDQGETSGSVRVLDGLSSQPPALDVSAPKSQPSGARPGNSDPAPLSDSLSGKDTPTIIRPGYKGPADALTPALTDTPYPPTPTSRPAQTQRAPTSARGSSSGSTINGWDTSDSKARTKQRFPGSTTAATQGFVAPRPLMRVMPKTSSIPNGILQTKTRVQVRVHLDASGNVANAQVVGAPVDATVASAALTAARQWTFEPATSNGRRVASDHTIVFEFPARH